MHHRQWVGLLAAVALLALTAVLTSGSTSTQAHAGDLPANPTSGGGEATRVLNGPLGSAPPLTPCSGSWSIQSSYPISVSEQAVAAQGDALYSFGGYDGTTSLAASYKYTPATNTWTAIAPLPAPRAEHQAVSDGTAIYILGGNEFGTASFSTNTLWRYNPTTNTYTTLAPYLIPTEAHAAAYLDGKIYRIGGCGSQSPFSCVGGGATDSVEVYTIATNAWAAAAPYPFRTAFLMAVGYNGYVYGAGGFWIGGKTYRYDPATDRWDDDAIADLPTNDDFGAASALLNGRWLLAGGVDGTLERAIAWNLTTNTWEPVPTVPQGRWFGGGATVGSAFYAVGGLDGNIVSNTNQRYLEVPCTTPTPTGTPPTPTSTPTICGVGHWQQEASIPTLLINNALVAHGGKLYSFGGEGAMPRVLTATYRYDPATTVWTPRAPLPAPRLGARAVSDGTNIYILGGDAGGGGAALTNTLWRYDPVADTYTTLAPYTIPTADHAAVLLNGKIYRIAGETYNLGYTSSVEVYTIATDSWSPAADYPQPLALPATVPLNGYIYSAGGGTGGYPSVATAKTYRYDPASDSWDDAAVADLPQVRQAAATAVYNGRWLIAAGGEGTTTSYASTLAWTPATNTWTNLPDLNRGRFIVAGAALSEGFYTTGGYDDQYHVTTDNQRYSEIPCGVTPTATATPTSPAIPTATPTVTSCTVTFTDVPVGSTFYEYVRCLACRGIVGGYPCGGPGEPCPGNYYRSTLNVTRGQVSKIVVSAAGFSEGIPSTQQTFEDVAPGSTFHLYIERLAGRAILGGYPCGGPFEPCVAPTNRPYFRPNNNVTRGQLSKITAGAAGWTETPTAQTFADVPPASTFYLWVERLSSRGIIGGYPCGGVGEPCVAPGNRPYFRPNNPATRGQMSKIAAAAFFPNCATPARR